MGFDFTNKQVLISGSSRGIGKRTAQLFAEAGAQVIIHYHRHRDEAARTLSSLPGTGHMMLESPLEDSEAIGVFVEKILQTGRQIDILVNNAGIYEPCPLETSDWDEWKTKWDRTLSINLSAPAHLSWHIARQMILHGGGKIINISSRGAFRGEPDAPAYGASKAGLNALTQSLAKALAPHHIYVYAVAPGFVETEMAASALMGPLGDEIRNQSPLGRVATPDDVAHAVLMLAADGTEFMTGTIVDVNGASYLRM